MTRRTGVTAGVCAWLIVSAAGALVRAQAPTPTSGPGFPAIDGQAVLRHTKVLSAGEFEGRMPGGKGEDLTIKYLVEQFKQAGLAPGNPDGTYLQAVPLVGITPRPGVRLDIRKGESSRSLKFGDEVVCWTKRMVDAIDVESSDMVFVGYGAQAPEFQWDDIKGMDLKGKTLVVLIGDPPVPDPSNPSQLDPNVFGGRAMTYHGRWTSKFDLGQRVGAAAVLIVHETGPAGYPFSVVQVKTGEQFDIAREDGNMSHPALEGWITLDVARELFRLAGQDFDRLKAASVDRAFRPVPLGTTASFHLRNTIRRFDSRNVVGKVEGRDPALKNEYVVYSAHWDALGVGEPVNGDAVRHGAKDNAVAVGGLIEVARAFVNVSPKPKRSVLFLAVTAEEQNLLGSEYYATHPLYPLARTAANVNIEMLNVHGPTRDLTVIGLGQSELDDYARDVAALKKKTLRPDPEPERGMYYRSDHFSFARQGVPAFEPDEGVDYIGKPADYATKVRGDFFANDYHKPTDVVRADWDLTGGVEDLQIFWMVGYRVADAERQPRWKPGSEFKARGDARR